MPWIEANGTSLRYGLSGSGKKTVVLMHELGGCIESFDDTLPDLAKDFRVLRYDQCGFGLSEKVKNLTFQKVIADLASLLDALEIRDPICLAGCARGSDFCAGFAAAHPQRVAKLVLASPDIGEMRMATRSLTRAARMETEGVRSTLETSLAISYPEAVRAFDIERFNRFAARWVCNTPASFMAQAKMMSQVDLTTEYPKIQAKTLVIGATHDGQRSIDVARQVAQAINGACLVECNTGHFMAVQTPELFAEVVRNFFN